jgi:choline dehydrogenase-like flavoprotein
MIFDGEKEHRAVEEMFDYVIVGSGAAGATAARVLADTGASIAVVEEGPTVTTAEFGDKAFPAFRRIYRDMGLQTARGRAPIPVLQGSCLGGTTVVNSAIAWRIPDDVWQPWATEHGLAEALPLDELHQHWDQIERELAMRPTAAEVLGENNRLLAEASAKLGLAAMPTQRFENGCLGSGRCQLGCPHGAKQSMLVSYLPYASERGAALYTSARVSRVLMDGDRAVGVAGHFHVPPFKRNLAPFTLRARHGVLVAASAIQTPGLLARSGVRSPHLGRHFQGHPGMGLAARFDAPVTMWAGATQGYEMHQHRQAGRYKIESLALPPEALFARLPGAGHEWVAGMAEAGHLAVWAVQLRAYAEGSVRQGLLGTDIRFEMTQQDMTNLRKGLRLTAELMFAAGAREIYPGIHGLPRRLTTVDQAALIESGPSDPACYSLVLTHLFGTARMSVRPEQGVVGPDFAVHGTRGLYVIDSSIFPTNLGVNPQTPIMGIAMHAAKQIAEPFSQS